MATTSIIDPNGTVGVNCDFNTITDWWTWVRTQTDPDQIGLCRGATYLDEVIDGDLANSFTSTTTQTVHPRVVAENGWVSGAVVYDTVSPETVAYIPVDYSLTIKLSPTALSKLQHLSIHGLIVNYAYLTIGQSEGGTAHFQINRCCIEQIMSITAGNTGITSTTHTLASSSLFIGDGGINTINTAFHGDGDANHYLAFVGSVIAKGVPVDNQESSNITVSSYNSVWMCKEGYTLYESTGPWTCTGTNNASGLQAYEDLNGAGSANNAQGEWYTVSIWLPATEACPAYFVNSNYDGSNYALVESSTLQNAGTNTITVTDWNLASLNLTDINGTPRYSGTAWDIGLYEVDESPSATGTSSTPGTGTSSTPVGSSGVQETLFAKINAVRRNVDYDLGAKKQPAPRFSTNLVNLMGGMPLTVVSTEPDPLSFQYDYYYNATYNMLFQKIGSRWKPVGEHSLR